MLLAVPFLVTLALTFATWPAILALLLLPLAAKGARPIYRGATGRNLIPVIGATGKTMLFWAVLTAAALALGL